MPDRPQPMHTPRVFNNRIVANNNDNYGRAGTAVAAVPAGAGVVIMSNDDVEIFGNEIADNRTANVLIASHYSAGYASKYKPSAKFDPYPERIFIHDNRFSGGGGAPDGLAQKAPKVAMIGLRVPITDAISDDLHHDRTAQAH